MSKVVATSAAVIVPNIAIISLFSTKDSSSYKHEGHSSMLALTMATRK